jgi:hypothetical protein
VSLSNKQVLLRVKIPILLLSMFNNKTKISDLLSNQQHSFFVGLCSSKHCVGGWCCCLHWLRK